MADFDGYPVHLDGNTHFIPSRIILELAAFGEPQVPATVVTRALQTGKPARHALLQEVYSLHNITTRALQEDEGLRHVVDKTREQLLGNLGLFDGEVTRPFIYNQSC